MARILIVDDEEQLCEMLERMLDPGGHEVTSVFTTEDALSRISDQCFDLAVVDIFVPTHGGLEVIRELKSFAPETRIIAATGVNVQGGYDSLPLAIRHGADRALKKPFRKEEFLGLVADLLGT
ncbi:MAG: response regulator [Candidatus Latescibacteria bacterium]|jgi:CheY-like chemotaxis protein|nr:response regulator [Candidatus Latescibacterota bacterium]